MKVREGPGCPFRLPSLVSQGTVRRCPTHCHTCPVPRPCSCPWLSLSLGLLGLRAFGILYRRQSCGCRANRQPQPAPAWGRGLPGLPSSDGATEPWEPGLGPSETHPWPCQATRL